MRFGQSVVKGTDRCKNLQHALQNEILATPLSSAPSGLLSLVTARRIPRPLSAYPKIVILLLYRHPHNRPHMIRLEPCSIADLPDVLSWNFSVRELLQFGGSAFEHPLTAAQLERFLDKKGSQVFKAVAPSGSLLGMGEVIEVDADTAKLARIVIGDPGLRGKGLGKKFVILLLRHCWDVLGKKQVLLNVYDWNASAIRCYEQLGFRFVDGASLPFDAAGETWVSRAMVMRR